MRNISHKPDSHRVAVAATSVSMPEFWVGQVRDRALAKGDALEKEKEKRMPLRQ